MLESERIVFLNYKEDDISFLNKLLSNPNMVRYIGNGRVRNNEQTIKFFEWIVEHYNLNENYGLKILKDKVTGGTCTANCRGRGVYRSRVLD